MELWGPFLTVSGKRASFPGRSSGAQAQRSSALVRRRELDHGFFSATWKLPVRWAPHDQTCPHMSAGFVATPGPCFRAAHAPK